MNNQSKPDAAGGSKPSPESSNQAWDHWAKTLAVLGLAYPDAKLSDQEFAARTILYCESLTPVWRDADLIQRSLAKGRLAWKFFPTIAEINATLERQAERDWRDQQPSVRDRHFAQLEDHSPRKPMTAKQVEEIEMAKAHLANRAKEARKPTLPQSPAIAEAKARDRAKLTAGASPEWRELMGLPTP